MPLTFANASVIGKSQLVVCGAAIITHLAGTGSSRVTASKRHRNNQKRANREVMPRNLSVLGCE